MSIVLNSASVTTSPHPAVSFAWLEITPNCQLTCEHCYVASRPGLGHGKLSLADWKQTMDTLYTLGVQSIQFIGGEPTTHPSFCELVEYAAEKHFTIEVYSNLVSITKRMWDIFTQYNVHIATSFYSADAHVHDAITHLPGSYRKTLGNIKKVLESGLVLRVGIIDVCEDQDISEAESFLVHLGVDPSHIGTDRVRGVGRGFNLSKEDALSALCGNCTSGKCVVTAEGTVYPCIMARSFPLGSVLEQNIEAILAGVTFESVCNTLNDAFLARSIVIPGNDTYSVSKADPCNPKCNPFCNPGCNPGCQPGHPCNPTCNPTCKPAR